MDTNFHMIRNLGDWKPKRHGVLSGPEVEHLRKHFHIGERSNVELQNFRDFAVMYYAHKTEKNQSGWDDDWDLMSAITGVIDSEKISRGMEV